MRHHILREKLYNRLVIIQINLFIQKDDEVRRWWRWKNLVTILDFVTFKNPTDQNNWQHPLWESRICFQSYCGWQIRDSWVFCGRAVIYWLINGYAIFVRGASPFIEDVVLISPKGRCFFAERPLPLRRKATASSLKGRSFFAEKSFRWTQICSGMLIFIWMTTIEMYLC